MKVVIQHKTSFQYVRSETDWTDDPFKAYNFERIQSAADFCREHNLLKAYIVCGEFDAETKRFNAATKSILDVARIRPTGGRGKPSGFHPAPFLITLRHRTKDDCSPSTLGLNLQFRVDSPRITVHHSQAFGSSI